MRTATPDRIFPPSVKTLVLVVVLFGSWAAALAAPEESPQGASGRNEADRRVFRDRIAPHWFHDNTRFWYRNNLRGGAKEPHHGIEGLVGMVEEDVLPADAR